MVRAESSYKGSQESETKEFAATDGIPDAPTRVAGVTKLAEQYEGLGRRRGSESEWDPRTGRKREGVQGTRRGVVIYQSELLGCDFGGGLERGGLVCP